MPTLTQNTNFTLSFAILHEIPITQQSPQSRWEILSHNDSLGQNWLLKARTDAVFFEKCCPKIQFTVWKWPISLPSQTITWKRNESGLGCMQGERSTHCKGRTRFEWRTHIVDPVEIPVETPLRSHKPTPASHSLAPWSPPFPSSLMLGYLNLEQWSDLLIHGRPTTHFSTAY